MAETMQKDNVLVADFTMDILPVCVKGGTVIMSLSHPSRSNKAFSSWTFFAGSAKTCKLLPRLLSGFGSS